MIEVRRRELVQPTLLSYFTLTCCAGANLNLISFGGSPSNLLLMQNLHVFVTQTKTSAMRDDLLWENYICFLKVLSDQSPLGDGIFMASFVQRGEESRL